jgi:hypothetical protein
MYADSDTQKTLTGKVMKTLLGGTSKSAHQGFVLENEDTKIKLRRENGNPFYDDFFQPYEGHTVKVEGYDMEQYFLVMNIELMK